MTESEIIELFKTANALLTGHFQLHNGLHSDRFLQVALLLQFPDMAERICVHLTRGFAGKKIDAVVSPAVGSLIVGQEMARALGCRAIFADREEGELVLKRGFRLRPGENVLVVEDVVTKGSRVRQTMELVRTCGAEVTAAAVLVDRSDGAAHFDVPFHSALKLNFPTYEPQDCPLCKKGMPITRSGSK